MEQYPYKKSKYFDYFNRIELLILIVKIKVNLIRSDPSFRMSDPYPNPQHNSDGKNDERIRGAGVQVPEGGRSPHTGHHLQPLDQQD